MAREGGVRPARLAAAAVALGAFLAVLDATAGNITVGGRIGATYRQIFPLGPYDYRIWARRADGHLVTLHLPYTSGAPASANEGFWADRMPTGAPAIQPKVQGVDAIAWKRATDGAWEEHVAYVGSDGRLYDWRLVNGGPVGGDYKSFGPPPGDHTLTGNVAISRRYNPANQVTIPIVYATTVGGRLLALRITNWDAGQYAWDVLAGNISTTYTMVAASDAQDGTYSRAFVTTSDDANVRAYKYAGAWTNTSLVGPGNGPCGLLAAAEGTVGPSNYKTYLFCTRSGGTASDSLYYRTATGPGSENFGVAWSVKSLPLNTGSVATTGYALTARRRLEVNYHRIDAFLLNNAATATRLFHVEANGAGLGGIAEIGPDGETTGRTGGLVATGPESNTYSETFFVGLSGGASRLYRRIGDEEFSSLPRYWANHGGGELARNIETGVPGTPPGTEGSTAFFGGQAVNVAVYTNTTTIDVVKVRWSTDDGETWGSPVPIPLPPAPDYVPPFGVPDDPYRYLIDPWVDFGDDGTAYVVALATQTDGGGSCGGIYSGRGTFVWEVRNGPGGLSFTRYGPFDHVVAADNDRQDRPSISVYRNAGADIVHVAWQWLGGPFRYAWAPAGQLGHVLNGLASHLRTIDPVFGMGTPRLTVSQANGAVYLVSAWGICRINDAADDCDPDWLFPDELICHSTFNTNLTFPGTERYIAAIRSFSAIASPTTGNQVYYAFQQAEDGTDGDPPFDLWFSVITVDLGLPRTFTASPRQRLNMNPQDGWNQIMPELAVSRDGPTNSALFATWYDWGLNHSCTVETGETYVGRCYYVMGSESFDQGVSFSGPGIFSAGPADSDPDEIPGRCRDDPPKFIYIGDYNSVNGDLLHSARTGVLGPIGPNAETSNLVRWWASHGYSF